MALTYKVRDKKTLAVGPGVDTSEAMTIVRADITIGSASEVGTAASAASIVLSGSTAMSGLGLGSAGKVIEVLGATIRGSAGTLNAKLVPLFDANSEVLIVTHKQSNNSAAELVQAGSVDFAAGDIVRVTLLGRIGS